MHISRMSTTGPWGRRSAGAISLGIRWCPSSLVSSSSLLPSGICLVVRCQELNGAGKGLLGWGLNIHLMSHFPTLKCPSPQAQILSKEKTSSPLPKLGEEVVWPQGEESRRSNCSQFPAPSTS